MLLSISEIPENRPLILYGYGQAGSMLLSLLKIYRPKQKIKYIVDDQQTGFFSGLEIIDYKRLLEIYEKNDLILLSILISDEIENKLKTHIQLNYSLIRLNYFHHMDELEFFRSLLGSTPMYNSTLYPVKHYPNGENFNMVLSMFKDEEDRQLYSTIVKSWHDKGSLVKDYYVNNFADIGRHYFEYMDFSKITTIIEGGVADGTNSLEFLSMIPEDSMIFGFDPLFHAYEHYGHKNYLLNHNNIEINITGLWNKNTTLSIDTSGDLPLSRVADKNEARFVKSKDIEVITIDSFKKDKNIKKVDFIKLDIEGAELNCLKGAINTLKKDRPQLAISIYHNYKDLYEIPLFLNEVLDNYCYKLGHYHYQLGETVLYAFPNKS